MFILQPNELGKSVKTCKWKYSFWLGRYWFL